jgi:PUA-domain protein
VKRDMPEKNARYFLKDKEAKALFDKACRRLKADLKQILSDKPSFEVVKMEFGDIFLVNGRPLLVEARGQLYPTLVFTELFPAMPRVVVDMGAIPYICKGADVMAPGIRRLDGDFDRGDIVVVVDERHGKAVAIGEAVLDHEEASKADRGTVVKNIHFVSDKTWNRIKELEAKIKSDS